MVKSGQQSVVFLKAKEGNNVGRDGKIIWTLWSTKENGLLFKSGNCF